MLLASGTSSSELSEAFGRFKTGPKSSPESSSSSSEDVSDDDTKGKEGLL